jgi:hypothetical protein
MLLSHQSVFGAGLVACLFSSTAALALTPEELWANWQQSAAGAGLELAAETSAESGGVLKLANVTVRPSVASSADGSTGAIGEIILTGQPNGSVAIAMPPDFSMPISDMFKINISQQGLTLTASDDAGKLNYDYAGEMLTGAVEMALPQSAGDGSEAPATINLVGFEITKPNGTLATSAGDMRQIDVAINATKLRYTSEFRYPGVPTRSASTNEAADVAIVMKAELPVALNLTEMEGAADLAAALNEGLAVKMDFKQGISTTKDSEQNAALSYEIETNGLPSNGTMSFDKTGLALELDSEGNTVSVTSAFIPVPVKLGAGPVSMDFLMPLTGTDPKDFRFKMNVASLTVNEEVWGMIDPGKVLPRDPADLIVDASGIAVLPMIELIEAQENGEEPPVTLIESLDLKQLTLKVAGAAFTGTGAFTFDNSQGVPLPLGEANVSLTGGNALIDGLVAAGSVPEDQAVGVRTMMGAFMTPGAEPDSLTSKIEAKEGGSIFVNGQQIQ